MLAESPGGRCQAGAQDRGDPGGPALRSAPCRTDGTPPPETPRPEEAPENALKREGTVKKRNRQRAEGISKGEGRRFRQILSLTQN